MFAKKHSRRGTQGRHHAAGGRSSCFAEPLEGRLLMYVPYGGDAVWNFPNRSISYSYANVFDGSMSGVTNAQIVTAVEEGMGAWAAVTPLKFFELPDSGPVLGDNSATFADYDPAGNPFLRWEHHPMDGPSNTLAHALGPGDRGQNGDIHFDDGETWATSPGLNVIDITEVATHEFGHALGLNHEVDTDGAGPDTQALAVMNPFYGSLFSGPGSASLLPDDVAGIQSIYGPGLGYVISRSGDLHVFGTGNNDLITVNVSDGQLTATSQLIGGGPVQSFSRPINDGQTTVTRIHLHGQNGNDILRVEGNGGLQTFLNGNAGDDIADVQYNGRNFDNVGGEITYFSGPGNDLAFLYDNANTVGTFYTAFAGGVTSGLFRFNHDSENVTLITGRGADSVGVLGTGAGQRLFLDSAAGGDAVSVGSAGAGLLGVNGDVQVRNAPAHSTLSITDAASPWARQMRVSNDGTFTTLTGTPAPISWKNADVSDVTFTTGTASDRVEVQGINQPLTLRSAGGSDDVLVGSAAQGLQGIGAMLTVGVAGNVGLLSLSDAGSAVRRSPTVNLILGGMYNEVTGMAPAPIRYANVLNATFEFGQGGNDVLFNTPIPAGNELVLTGGNGAENIQLRGTSTPTVRVNGGGGFDYLFVDDRPGLPANIDSVSLFADHVDRYESPTPEDAGESFTVWYDDVQSLDLGNPLAQIITDVYGTSPDIPATHQTVIYGNASNDVVYVHPRDSAGNPTLASGLTFYGGLERDVLEVIDDSNLPSAYRIDNRLGTQAATIGGAGGGAGDINVSSDVDQINLYGGGGADTVVFDAFRTGTPLGIYTRGGDDALEVTPTSRNLSASVTNIAAFTFDGGGGRDSFTLHNESSAGDWAYTRQPDRLTAAVPGVYSMTFVIGGHEATTINAGPGADSFTLAASEPGHANTFNGGGGNDVLDLGGAPAAGAAPAGSVGTAAAANRVLDRIRGPVFFDGGPGADTASLDDSGDNSGDVLHLDEASVGAHRSDDFFGPGGSLRYAGAESVEMFLGNGGNTITARPSADTAFAITGGGYFSFGTDTIVLDVTGLGSVQYNTDFFGWVGTYTFADRRNIRLTYVEQRAEAVRSGTVVGHHVFYNNSAFDGRDPAAGAADDHAIAPDKHPTLAGGAPALATGAGAEVTSYTKGLNGVILDVAGLAPAGGGSPLGPDDFVFRAGPGADPAAWARAPAPASITVRRGQGDGGSDRVTLVWPDGALVNTWLEVTVLANLDTGVASSDVFSFGNLVGETGDAADAARVGSADLLRTRAAVSGRRVGLDNPFDHDRDGFVNARDLRAVLSNNGRSLALPTAIASAPRVGIFSDSAVRQAPRRRSILSMLNP